LYWFLALSTALSASIGDMPGEKFVGCFFPQEMATVATFLSFTPVLMIFVRFFILGETLNLWGETGILLMVSGSYILKLGRRKGGGLTVFAAIFREPGSLIYPAVGTINTCRLTFAVEMINGDKPRIPTPFSPKK